MQIYFLFWLQCSVVTYTIITWRWSPLKIFILWKDMMISNKHCKSKQFHRRIHLRTHDNRNIWIFNHTLLIANTSHFCSGGTRGGAWKYLSPSWRGCPHLLPSQNKKCQNQPFLVKFVDFPLRFFLFVPLQSPQKFWCRSGIFETKIYALVFKIFH